MMAVRIDRTIFTRSSLMRFRNEKIVGKDGMKSKTIITCPKKENFFISWKKIHDTIVRVIEIENSYVNYY